MDSNFTDLLVVVGKKSEFKIIHRSTTQLFCYLGSLKPTEKNYVTRFLFSVFQVTLITCSNNSNNGLLMLLTSTITARVHPLPSPPGTYIQTGSYISIVLINNFVWGRNQNERLMIFDNSFQLIKRLIKSFHQTFYDIRIYSHFKNQQHFSA